MFSQYKPLIVLRAKSPFILSVFDILRADREREERQYIDSLGIRVEARERF